MAKQHIKRLAMGIGALLLTCAPAMFGQNQPQVFSTDSYVDGQVTTNQCSSAGEPASLNGNLHADMTFTTDSEGVNHFSIAVSNNLNGTGQNSGLPIPRRIPTLTPLTAGARPAISPWSFAPT